MMSRTCVSTRTGSPPPDPARYQRNAGVAAEGRRDAGDFDEGLAFIARRLRFSVADLSRYESDLLDDFGRGASRDGEVRYRMKTLRAFMAVAARSSRPDDREALPELLRAEILRQSGADACLATAFDVETSTTGPADVAQRAFERAPTTGTWVVVRDALIRQLSATRSALDAVLMWGAAA